MPRHLPILTRADCEDGPRPCPHFMCRHHLMFGACVLDLADNGGMPLDEVAQHFGVSRERIRQIEVIALGKVKEALARRGIKEEDEAPTAADRLYVRKQSYTTRADVEEETPKTDAEPSDPYVAAPSFFDDTNERALTDAVWGMFAKRHRIRSNASKKQSAYQARKRAAGIDVTALPNAELANRAVKAAMDQIQAEGRYLTKDAVKAILAPGMVVSEKSIANHITGRLKGDKIRAEGETREPLPVPKVNTDFWEGDGPREPRPALGRPSEPEPGDEPDDEPEPTSVAPPKRTYRRKLAFEAEVRRAVQELTTQKMKITTATVSAFLGVSQTHAYNTMRAMRDHGEEVPRTVQGRDFYNRVETACRALMAMGKQVSVTAIRKHLHLSDWNGSVTRVLRRVRRDHADIARPSTPSSKPGKLMLAAYRMALVLMDRGEDPSPRAVFRVMDPAIAKSEANVRNTLGVLRRRGLLPERKAKRGKPAKVAVHGGAEARRQEPDA